MIRKMESQDRKGYMDRAFTRRKSNYEFGITNYEWILLLNESLCRCADV